MAEKGELTRDVWQNWPASRKYASVAALSLATFAGFTSALAGQLEVGPLSEVYGLPTATLSYQVTNPDISPGGVVASAIGWP